MWAACVRYLLSKLVPERLSASPPSFIFVYFSEKLVFYEVSVQEPLQWAITTSLHEVRINDALVCKFLTTAKSSLDSEERQSTRDSFARSTQERSTERLLLEQSRTLQDLQQQVHELRKQIGSPTLKKPKGLLSDSQLRLYRSRGSVGGNVTQRPELVMPKIVYERRSSDEESIEAIQQKYLR